MACLSFIVAVAENGVIGNKGDLPWHLPADLKRFKARTLGKPIAMGRKTHESIGRPLPGRPNWVLTRSPEKIHPDCRVFGSIEDLVAAAENESEVMIIGGAELYKALLPHAKRLCLTVVHCAPEGDAFFLRCTDRTGASRNATILAQMRKMRWHKRSSCWSEPLTI